MMKSYTLNNWDGNLMGSEDTTPQTVSNSVTGAHALASNLQSSGSSYDPNFGKTIGNTLYGGDQGKGGISTDNGFHDASTEGGSMFDSWVNGEMYSIDDVPSSSKGPLGMKQDQSQTGPCESESSFKNASREIGNGILAEGYAYTQTLLLPRNTAGTIGGAAEPLEASSPMPDASSSTNLEIERASYSTAKDLNPDMLAFSTTDISDAPSGFVTIQTGLLFKPDLNSPLHTVRPSELSRRSPIPSNSSQLNLLDIPMKSPMSSIYLHSNIPSPRSENHNSDAISVHTADGEGTDEDDDVIILENIPSTHSSEKPSYEMDEDDALFTPPPYVAVEDLFTPPPAKSKRPRPPQKVFMSHVSLPPPRHQPKIARISRPPPKKKPRPVAQVEVHNDLARAMQASWDNNDSLGTLPLNNKVIKVNRPKPKGPKYQGNKPPVAGPSRYSSESTSVSRDVRQTKRRRHDFEEREESASVSSKKPRITIDLTLPDDVSETKKRKREEVARPKPRPKPKPKQLPPPIAPIPNSGKIHAKAPPLAPARTKYIAEDDCVRLLLGTIRETPPDLVFHNTRFVRRRVHGVATSLEDTQQCFEGSTWGSSSKGRTRKNVDINRLSVWPRSKTTTSTTASEDEKSVGGRLFWAEGFEGDDEDGDDGDDGDGNDVVVVTKGPLRQDAAPRPSLPPAPPPPKIDLAAQFKKRQRKMQAPPQKPAPTAVTVSSSPSVTSIRPATIQTPTVTASSSPSVRPTTTQIHTARPSLSASNGNAELAPTPSAKALGKRKAVSPSPPMTGTSVYHPNYPSANQPEGPSNYPHPYNQSLPAQSSLFASSSSTTVTYLQPPAIVEYYPNLNSGTTSLGAYLYPPQPVPHIITNGFGQHTSGQSASWPTQAATEQLQEYTYATIDPTWLDGQPSAATHQEPEPDLGLSHDDIFNIPSSPAQQEADPESAADTHSDVFPISHPPTRLSAQIEVPPESPSDLFQIPPSLLNDQDEAYEPSASIFQSLPDTEGPRLTDDSRSPSVPVFKLPPRRGRGRSTTSEYASSAPSSDDDNDYSESEVVSVNKRKPRSAALTSRASLQKEPATFSTPLFTTLTRADQVEYPLEESAEYCHQCRRKTFYLKMACRCNTLICCRCVALRYPDKKFNIKVKQQTCPRCEDYCNCTLCCQKRGVPYISSTRGYQAQQHAAPKAKRLPTVLLSAVPPPNAQYWGAIYSLDGQKMGATFAAPAGDALPSVAFAGSIAQRRPAEKLKRTFVGSLQRSWGFGRDRLIKELNPVRQMKSKSRPRKNDRLVTRSFVGSASFLRYRPRFLTPDPLDEEDLLAGLSPLTSLSSDSEDEHDKIKIGISILAPPEEAFTPGCLEERDVARAIAAAFEALGIPPIFELPYYCS